MKFYVLFLLMYQWNKLYAESYLARSKPCSPKKINRRFEGPYILNLKGGSVNHSRNQQEAGFAAVRMSNLKNCTSFHTAVKRKIRLSKRNEVTNL